MLGKKTLALVGAALFAAAPLMAAPPQDPKTEDEKTLYALGLLLARNVAPFNLSAADLEMVKAGLTDGLLAKTKKVDIEAYGPKIQGLAQSRMAATAAEEKKKSAAFLAQAEKEKGVKKLPSGVLVTEIKAGTGASPKPTDTVKVHYHGTLIDGTVFDSSVKRGQPAEFPLNGVIPCWTQGVGTMKVGGKSKLVCPADTAYGDQGQPPVIKGGATLIFEVELLETKATPASAPASAAPPRPAGKK